MSPPKARRHPPSLPDDLVEEVLARLPPDDPALLVRTALVCKDWCRLISSPGFRRRFRQFHRTPPLLGYLYHHEAPSLPNFVPTSSFRPPCAARQGWLILNGRHGRVLVLVLKMISSVGPEEKEFIAWDPTSDEQHRVPLPPFKYKSWSAALLCAAPGCDHLDCPWGPFLVVFVFTRGGEEGIISACVYSSEQGAWREPISVHHQGRCVVHHLQGSNALVRNAIYFVYHTMTDSILKYDLCKHELSMISLPPLLGLGYWHLVLMEAEDGGLGFAIVKEPKLCLWSRVAGPDGYATWAQQRVIELDVVLPVGGLSTPPYGYYTVAIAYDGGVVFIWADKKLFTIDLKSSRVEKVVGNVAFAFSIVPYTNFYTPALGAAFTGEDAKADASSSCQI